MRTSAFTFLALAAIACGAGDPTGDPECGPNGQCPIGLTCEPISRRCIRDGRTPIDAGGTSDATAPRDAPADAASDARALDTLLGDRPPAVSGPRVIFGFSATAEAATFECSLDQAAFAACAPPLAISDLAGGLHRFEVRAVAGGARDPSPASYEWRVDATAPVTTITEGPNAITNLTTTRIAFAVSPAGSTSECSVDGAGFAPCASPRELTGQTAGAHTFITRATSPTGVIEVAPPRVVWTIDLAPPVVTIDAPAAGATTGKQARLVYSAQESLARFECRLDSGGFAACGSGTAGEQPLTLAGGPHTAAVRGVDAAGNVGPESTVAFTTDARPPVVTVLPRAGACVTDPVVFTADEPATFACALGGAGAAPCTSPLSLPEGLADGAHLLRIQATDAFGNAAEPITVGVSVDGTGPAVFFTADDGGFLGATGEIPFHSDGTATWYRCALDGAAVTDCPPAPLTDDATFAYSDLSPDGNPHELVVTALDACGNEATTRYSFEVEAAGPTFTLGRISAPEGSGRITIQYTASEATSQVTCLLDGLACASCSATGATCTEVSAGAHVFTVSGLDAHGNRGQATSAQIVMSYGPSSGHAVLIGHDYRTSNSGADGVLRRAVQQAPFLARSIFVRPLRVAAYRPASVPAVEADNALAAISDLVSRDLYEEVADAARLPGALAGKDVVLVFDLQDPAAATAAGVAWAQLLGDFLDRGGVVVVLDGLRDDAQTPSETYRVLGGGSSPILTIGGSARFHGLGQTEAIRIDDLNDARHADDISRLSVGPSYPAPASSVVFSVQGDTEQPRPVYGRFLAEIAPVVIDKIFPVYALSTGLGAFVAPRGAIPFTLAPATPYLRVDCAARNEATGATSGCGGDHQAGFSLPYQSVGRYRVELRLVDPYGNPGRGVASLVEIGELSAVITYTGFDPNRPDLFGTFCYRADPIDGRAVVYTLKFDNLIVQPDDPTIPQCAQDAGSVSYRAYCDGDNFFEVEVVDAFGNSAYAIFKWWHGC